MTLLAALLAAFAAYTIVAALAGWNTPVPPRRTPRRQRPSLGERLRQSGVPMPAGRYRATVWGSVAAATIAVYALTSTPALAVLTGLFVGWLPRWFYRRRRDRELAARVDAWPEAIRDVLAALMVDSTLHQALVRLGDSGPEPLRPTWRRYARNATVIDQRSALRIARGDLADPVSDRVLEAFDAAFDRGTETAVTVLRSLADNVAADLQLREEIVTGQADIRSQAVLVMFIPFAVLAFLIARNDTYADYYRSSGGWIILAVGAALALAGWKLITTLGRVPDEPRLLTREDTP